MSSNVFRVYRSSAGSGKTRTLAKEYIKLALQFDSNYYRHILAVTFTNKATQEMKQRILHYLDEFAKGKVNDLSTEIANELNLTKVQLIEKSKTVQSAILHHYSQFSISTIDAFFQKVIRSFTREAGLLGNFRLEVENDLVLRDVIEELMDELGEKTEQTKWVVDFSRDKLLEGENWNIRAALHEFTREIFKEEFQAIEDKLMKPEGEDNPYRHTMNLLYDLTSGFEKIMKEKAKGALVLLGQHGITADDFNYKDQGTVIKYFQEFAENRYFSSEGKRMQSAISDSKSWPGKKSRNYAKLVDLAERELLPILHDMVQYDNAHRTEYLTAKQILKNFYAFGLISHITQKLSAYKRENNIMLLSDAPKFLNGVINESDTPFIYEKVGSYFRNYLIDEFQDTSGFQWKNFQPLLKDALDQNQGSVIVGDVKQSIYRWRGGDQELLQEDVTRVMGKEVVEENVLEKNYRSAKNIIDFNNELFPVAARQVSELAGQPQAEEAYRDVVQKTDKADGKGFVQIRFIESVDEDRDWMDEVIDLLPGKLEELQDKKIELRDIAILVRKNEEGHRIATSLLAYQNTKAKKGYRYDVVSNESLRLETASSVSLLICALKFLETPHDAVVRGELSFEVAKNEKIQSLFVDAGKNDLKDILPEEFLSNVTWLGKLSIFELTEEIIRIFKLGSQQGELAYLQAFQDVVLEFSAYEKNDLATFLEWWETIKDKKSIQVSANIDAVNILTIHKAKGLEFRYVIIPFLNWRLNHDKNPLLWVHLKEKPFNEMGFLPIRFKSALAETFFNNEYQIEKGKAHLDNLNLLYVALTRAENGLIGFALRPTQKQEAKPGSVGDLVYTSIIKNAGLLKNFSDNLFEVGLVEKMSAEKEATDYQTIQLDTYASYDWRDKLVIKREGAEYFMEHTTEQRSRINYGILLHRVLAHISYKQQAEASLQQLHVQNVITDDECKVLTEKVSQLIDHPVIGNWFSKEWEVLTEVPVLVPGGRQSRMDRVLLGKKKTVVIDYKTGEKREQDRKQVESYAGLLSEMKYPNVEAYLLYLDPLEVVEVVKGSTLQLEF